MSNDIKELIEELKYSYEITMPKQEYFGYIKGIEDYITNLEEELEEYKDTETYSKRFLYKANKDRLNANLELLQENERLKTKTKEQSLLLIDYQDMEQKLEDYKSRIDKAIEIIDLIKPELWNINNGMTYRLIDIKNILRGDKE